MCTAELLKYGAAGVAAASGVASGLAARDAADQNAAFRRLQAHEVSGAAAVEALRVQREARQLVGQQRAALGANNVNTGVGTALKLQEDALAVGEEDAMTIRNNAARQAWGLRQSAAIEKDLGQKALLSSSVSGFATALTHGADALAYRKTR